MLNTETLKRKLGNALKDHTFPTDITTEERMFLQSLINREKELSIDCAINPTGQYMTVREEKPIMWRKLLSMLNDKSTKCECCHTEEANELHEVWSYRVRDETCYKTLTGIKRLCKKCHTLSHPVRFINFCRTGSYFVPDYSIRTTAEGYKGEDYFIKLSEERHNTCSSLTAEEWYILNMTKYCISNFYRLTYNNFKLDIKYFYAYFRKVENNNDRL